jgi:hypothetical protein
LNVDFSLIDGFTKADKDAQCTREELLEEGIFVGNSGAAIKGLLQLKDHFRRCCSFISRFG